MARYEDHTVGDLNVERTLTVAGTDITDAISELAALDGVTATADELNLLDDAPANVTIAYAASATTDGIEATLTVVDAAGATIDAVHSVEVWISDAADGIALTSTSASGALTAVVGTIRTATTAKKHIQALTAATGILTLLLVDSANTADERFVCKHPLTSKIVVGAATVATDYEGGV